MVSSWVISYIRVTRVIIKTEHFEKESQENDVYQIFIQYQYIKIAGYP
jgi:hypothetical protein